MSNPRPVYFEHLTPDMIGRLTRYYRQHTLETGDDYMNVNHNNPLIAERLDAPLEWEVVMYRDMPHVLVKPNAGGGSVPPLAQKQEFENELVPFILPLEGTYFEVSNTAYKYIVYNKL